MRRMIPVTATALALLGTPIVAQGVPDTDGSGTLSMEELRAVYPSVTEEQFAQIDANTDGEVDADEFDAAQAAGILEG